MKSGQNESYKCFLRSTRRVVVIVVVVVAGAAGAGAGSGAFG